MTSISYKVNKLLEAKKITKTAFAKQVGIHIDTVYNLTDESIKLSTLLKFCEVLNVPINHFLETENYEKTLVNNVFTKEGETITIQLDGKEILNINLNENRLQVFKKTDTKIDIKHTKTAQKKQIDKK